MFTKMDTLEDNDITENITESAMSRSLSEDYEICEKLGDGKSGVVFRCISRSKRESLAVKSIRKSPKSFDADCEAKILRHLPPHPNIIKLHDLYGGESHLYLIMDFCPNGDLFNLIVSKGFLSENEARVIFLQLMEAISHCHKYGVVHRDIKPENVLLDAENSVKLADFGLAKSVQNGETMNEVVGSAFYVAPEVLIGKEYREKVDVWSAGVVLYVMLIGFPPFDGETNSEIRRAILGENLRFPASRWVSASAMDLLSRVLCKNPSKRLSVEEVLSDSWVRSRKRKRASVEEVPSDSHENEKRASA